MRAELGGEILETGPAPGGVLNLNTLGDAVMAASRVLTKYDNTTNRPLSLQSHILPDELAKPFEIWTLGITRHRLNRKMLPL